MDDPFKETLAALESLPEAWRKAFEDEEFEFGKIPDVPPPLGVR